MGSILGFLWTFLQLLLVVTTLVIIIIYVFYKKQFKYWNKIGAPHSKTPVFIFGDLKESNFTKSIAEEIVGIYERSKNEKFYGIWMLFRPCLLIYDPDIIKRILVSDFQHFHDHGFYADEVNDPLSGHLFSLQGSKWRNLRVKLSPTFTSGKMKMMFPILIECAEELKHHLDEFADEEKTIEVKDLLVRFTMDIISSCAFGVQPNSLKNPKSEFLSNGRKIFEPTFEASYRFVLPLLLPQVVKLFKIKVLPKKAEQFYLNLVSDTISYRENNNVIRNDFMQLLMDLKNKGFIDDVDAPSQKHKDADGCQKFSIGELAAQAFIFLVAGFETSSTTLQFCLYELALNPDVQKKAQENVDKVLAQHGGKITYDGLQQMEYLERVILETLRKYPPVATLTRECTKEYVIPDTAIKIEKGVLVGVPIIGIHRDEKYFPKPDLFDPDRFTDEEKAKRPHYVYLPFGEGPRVCIGMRFGMMQVKVGLTTILSRYNVSVAKETAIPLIIDPKSTVMTPKGGMHLKLSHRNK